MITVYFKWYEIAGMFVGAALLIAGLVLIVVKCRKREDLNRTVSVGVFCAVTALTLVVGKVSVELGDIDWEKTSLVDAYAELRLRLWLYLYLRRFRHRAAHRVSEELVEEIAGDVIEPTAAPEPAEAEPLTPNVILCSWNRSSTSTTSQARSFPRSPFPCSAN